MKKAMIVVMALILLVSTAMIASSASVMINPSAPSDNDDLTCSVVGSTEDMDFYWYKNGPEFKAEYGMQSTVSASETKPGDTWKCAAYTSSDNKIGEAEVKIPDVQIGNVVITPDQPADSDNLVCSVTGSSDSHDFTWYRNGNQFSTESAVTSTLDNINTEPGDSWRCVATGDGESTVQIDSDSTGSVWISPSNPRTDDTLRASVNSNGQYEYSWFKNDNEVKNEVSYSSNIYSSQTKKGEIWKVKAYTPLYHRNVGEASVKILNTAPVITLISAPESAKSGEKVTISFVAEDADDDDLSYAIAQDSSIVIYSNSYAWTADEESIFDLWAFDNEEWTSESISISIGGKYGKGITLYDLDIYPVAVGNDEYIKIKNTDHSVMGATMRITAVDTNEIKYYNLDMPRNTVKLIPLNFNFAENNSYLLRIDISSNDFDGKGYMLVET